MKLEVLVRESSRPPLLDFRVALAEVSDASLKPSESRSKSSARHTLCLMPLWISRNLGNQLTHIAN